MQERSSYYKNKPTFREIFQTLLFTMDKPPKSIIEFGILDGYSLSALTDFCDPTTRITAYDIFDNFNGNHADQNAVVERFKVCPNVFIKQGDFYDTKLIDSIPNKSVDVLHIDIANDGKVYEFAIHNYYCKLSDNGVMILEGGSPERDQVDWMTRYNKVPINKTLNTLKKSKHLHITTIQSFPSLTLIKPKSCSNQSV